MEAQQLCSASAPAATMTGINLGFSMYSQPALTRRLLLGGFGSALLGSPLLAQGGQRLGLALYTLRNVLVERPSESLRAAAEIGYTEVEIMRSHLAGLMPHLKAAGLTPVSVHFETPLITGNWQAWKDAEMPPVDQNLTLERTIEECRTHGLRNLVFNYLPPKERGELDYYRSLADKLNVAAEKCGEAGMRLWYHNHNFEFQTKTGGRPIDVLLERLDKKLIDLEVDLFWVSMAGLDPADFVRENTGRVVAIHLKDHPRDAAVPKYDISSVPKDTYREVGTGGLNFPKILAVAREAKVKHYFVEQDHSADPVQSIRTSYAAVRKFGF